MVVVVVVVRRGGSESENSVDSILSPMNTYYQYINHLPGRPVGAAVRRVSYDRLMDPRIRRFDPRMMHFFFSNRKSPYGLARTDLSPSPSE